MDKNTIKALKDIRRKGKATWDVRKILSERGYDLGKDCEWGNMSSGAHRHPIMKNGEIVGLAKFMSLQGFTCLKVGRFKAVHYRNVTSMAVKFVEA